MTEPLIERRAEAYPWKQRRLFLYVTTAFYMAAIGFVIAMDRSSAVAETVAMMCAVGIMTNVGSYVFGAAWQDVTQIRAKAATKTAEALPS